MQNQHQSAPPSVARGHTGRSRHLGAAPASADPQTRSRGDDVTPQRHSAKRPATQRWAAAAMVGIAACCVACRVSAQSLPRPTASAATPAGGPAEPSAQDARDSRSERTQFAISANPLNFIIGRYGLNFEYQPIAHHGVILTPYFLYLNGNGRDDCSDANCKDSLRGGGLELGYRFYTSKRGFHGFFASPSLLVTTFDSGSTYYGSESHRNHTSLGVAFDVGGQWQVGHFIIGGGIGVQRKWFTGERYGIPERGFGAIFMSWNASDENLLRLLMSVGYAF